MDGIVGRCRWQFYGNDLTVQYRHLPVGLLRPTFFTLCCPYVAEGQ